MIDNKTALEMIDQAINTANEIEDDWSIASQIQYCRGLVDAFYLCDLISTTEQDNYINILYKLRDEAFSIKDTPDLNPE
ncbi:TPA: hypothetical protein JI101_16590 [Acinetobacter baumannii]|nr:hypothetical protein [Acinetobacter baumannii]